METSQAYDIVTGKCRQLFKKKTSDYGTSWRILRISALTDQLYIKATRIRTLEENSVRKIDEGEMEEFTGIVNYCVMGLIQMDIDANASLQLEMDEALKLYDDEIAISKKLMMDKNHDYGEAWREMRVSSFTDLILMKLLRIKQIEDNEGVTVVSEGIDAGYRDMLNYACFALIKLNHLV